MMVKLVENIKQMKGGERNVGFQEAIAMPNEAEGGEKEKGHPEG